MLGFKLLSQTSLKPITGGGQREGEAKELRGWLMACEDKPAAGSPLKGVG